MGLSPDMNQAAPPAQAIIAFGGNLGHVRHSFFGARDMLAAEDDISLLSSSRMYRSAPMGPQDQPDYLNAAVLIQCSLSALHLLHRMQVIEQHFGRKRDAQRWGERTLDLDLIAYDDTQMQSDELTLPHPGMQDRLFVLQPLHDICPEWQHPVTGKSVTHMLQQLIQAGKIPLSEGEVW